MGIVSSADVQAVLGHLQALAGSTSSPLKVHETVLRHGTPTVASLRIRTPLNQDDTTGTRSDVRHESKYMASREARKLPASVRTVTSSSCSTDGCYRFWAALGYAVDHELIMDGCSFLIYQEGHQVRVALYLLKRLKAPGLVTGAEALTEDMQIVDATCSTRPDAYTAAAEAIGALAKSLAPLVDLKPVQ